MKSSLVWIFVFGGATLLLFGDSVNAWGGLFNRFSPEMLTNLETVNRGFYPFGQSDIYVDDEPIPENEPCYGKRCTANEHCCPGSVCVDVDGGTGNCLFAYGRKLGEMCGQHADCESGLICDISISGASVCSIPKAIAKQYAEECVASSDCDITRGLCCQLNRRHRQAARKICSYFKDPMTCIGTVATDKIKHEVQHTAGEKRVTSAFKHGLH